MNRREFLQTTGILLVGGKLILDELIDYNKRETRKDIYKLSDYVYMGKYETTDKNEHKREAEGYGICLGNYFITVNHIPSSAEKSYTMTPFGVIETGIEIVDKKATLEGLTMDEVIRLPKRDVAIYELNKDKMKEHGLEPFPCEPNTKRNLGDRIYLIGNPKLNGFNIRETTISDLDGLDKISVEEINLKDSTFGFSSTAIPGDSGTPIVNEDYKLIGLTNIHFNGLGYGVKIEEFLNNIK